MTRVFVYLLLFGLILYMLSAMNRRQQADSPSSRDGSQPNKPSRWFRPKINPRELWSQVYETASLDEARLMQARLQEEEIECVIYEQGKKDIHGNQMTGIGVSVPKTAMTHAQRIISRMLS